MNPTIHWRCPETRDPFLRAFRADAAARYQRLQAERSRAGLEEPGMDGRQLLQLLVGAQAGFASCRGAP